MEILVIDAQGGGMGCELVGQLRVALGPQARIIAVGTNVLATNAMLKAGATAGATGENAAVFNAEQADVILGPIGIIMANAMLGEITPAIACAVSSSRAEKILIPATRCAVKVMGLHSASLSAYIAEAVAVVKNLMGDCQERK